VKKISSPCAIVATVEVQEFGLEDKDAPTVTKLSRSDLFKGMKKKLKARAMPQQVAARCSNAGTNHSKGSASAPARRYR
jgi:hypothetical protein